MILKGWKDIAKYLGCGVRTVQRWEGRLGLPVRRPSRGPRSAVVALTKDLDAWLRSDSSSRDTPEHKGDLSRRFQYRILIVDHDEKSLVTLSTVLMRETYEVRTARDGFEALAIMRDSVPDLLISDLEMPNMSGFELLGVVRRRFPGLTVIVFSGDFTPAIAPAILCDQHIEKGPNARTMLVASVRRLLSHSPLRAQPAKTVEGAVWLPKPTNGYIVLTCTSCLRSFPLMRRNVEIGKDAAIACDHCGAEVKYHITDSALPIADDLKKINQHLRQRRHPQSEN
jgi:CheY-like chemotaxis protein